MKTFIHHDFAKLERDTAADGRRVYKTPEGNLYPSVTSITGVNSTFDRAAWERRVGVDEANRITTRALDRGTRVHSLCENFLLGNEIAVDMFDQDMWSTMRPLLDKIDNIHCLETPLYSDFLKAAGTVDCIADYEGKLSVIDFKTSSRVKERNDIHNYFEQTAAYSVMFEERTGIPVGRLVILMVIDDDTPRIFIEKRDSWIAGFRKQRLDYRNKFNI
jgi:genome maintenance exonuclease 1